MSRVQWFLVRFWKLDDEIFLVVRGATIRLVVLHKFESLQNAAWICVEQVELLYNVLVLRQEPAPTPCHNRTLAEEQGGGYGMFAPYGGNRQTRSFTLIGL